MGYHTDYQGRVDIDPPLSPEIVATLKKFNDTRHEGAGYPAVWCPWRPTANGTGLLWDGREKPYEGEAWMRYLINRYFAGKHVLNGRFEAQGDEEDDHWLLIVENNQVRREDLPPVIGKAAILYQLSDLLERLEDLSKADIRVSLDSIKTQIEGLDE